MLATGVVVAVVVRDRNLDGVGPLVSVFGFIVSLAGLITTTLKADPVAAPADAALNRAVEALAEAVRLQWQAEWRLRRLQDPEPLQVRWTAAEPWLADLDHNVGWQEGRPRELDGQLADITAAFAGVPSRRLVVLGAPGSGKTVLAVRFTLDLLECRTAGEPVPVIFPLSTWQPERTDLHVWLSSRLVTDYPALGSVQPSGSVLASELLASGRILPVLDGLDEIAAPLRASAVRRLNSELDSGSPLLLTCRNEVYAQVVMDGDVFTSAAVVELQPLSFDAAAAFLLRTARPMRGPSGERVTAWDMVITCSRPGDPLRQVLASPLMVAMARAVYDGTGADPQELLRRPEFADPAVLEKHLLDGFVPAAFGGAKRWSAGQARRWLGFLAWHLERRGTRDLAWWELPSALPGPLSRLAPILLLAVVTEAVCLPLWLFGADPALPVGAAAAVAGLCVGQAGQSRRGNRIPRQMLIPLVCAVPLALFIGLTRPLSEDPYWPVPYAGLEQVSGWIAVGGLYGLAVATALAPIGVTAAPAPSTMPFFTPGQKRRVQWIWKGTAGLVSAGVAFILVGNVLPDSPTVARLAALAAGLLAAFLVRGAVSEVARTESRRNPADRIRRLSRILVRGFAAGMLAGLGLGTVFSLAEGGSVALRAMAQDDFPVQGRIRQQADGTRYVDATDGARWALSPDGGTSIILPKPVRGMLVQHNGVTEFALPKDVRDLGGCAPPARCTAVNERIIISAHDYLHDGEVFVIKLANGNEMGAYDLSPLLDQAQWEWLTRQSPGHLFGSALAFGLLSGLGLGVIAGIAVGLHRWLGTPVDVTRTPSPSASLHTDRSAAFVRGLFICLVGFLTAALLLGVLPDVVGDGFFAFLPIGFFAFLPVGLVTIALSAWGRLTVARLWLSVSGALPWRLMTFLDEAHRHGVLRQAGAVYQFRHARLQERLATASRADNAGGDTP
ncbi:NACHT domain-containing protein [Streptomyces sp. NPDC020799]|uniref:NACHT domain-containing protein n=1 Tax=Streptomyces sp. NPDC020799 TaxID=3365091 RepID=UPI0037965471